MEETNQRKIRYKLTIIFNEQKGRFFLPFIDVYSCIIIATYLYVSTVLRKLIDVGT